MQAIPAPTESIVPDRPLRAFEASLDRLAAKGQRASFWWRDDDAALWAPSLQRMVDLTVQFKAPMILAVIPGRMAAELPDRLAAYPNIAVAAHGWMHLDHAPPGDPQQELGDDRPIDLVLEELRRSHRQSSQAFGPQYLSMLVPPWNRISERIADRLAEIGFESLSGAAPSGKVSGISVLNTHLDVIDWRGPPHCKRYWQLSARLAHHASSGGPVGLLTHHLVMDDHAWFFLERFLQLVTTHPAAVLLPAAEAIQEAAVATDPPRRLLGNLRGQWLLRAMRG